MSQISHLQPNKTLSPKTVKFSGWRLNLMAGLALLGGATAVAQNKDIIDISRTPYIGSVIPDTPDGILLYKVNGKSVTMSMDKLIREYRAEPQFKLLELQLALACDLETDTEPKTVAKDDYKKAKGELENMIQAILDEAVIENERIPFSVLMEDWSDSEKLKFVELMVTVAEGESYQDCLKDIKL